MIPKDHRQILFRGVLGRIDVEYLPLVRGLGVGNVTFDVLSLRDSRNSDGNDESQEERRAWFHF